MKKSQEDQGRGKKRILFFLLAAVLTIRLGPMLLGLEWRRDARIVLYLLGGAVLLLWCLYYVRSSEKKWLAAVLLAVLILYVYRGLFSSGYAESVILEDGVPAYVRVNEDPGSLASVRYYEYVNRVLRGLRGIEYGEW
ncbi:MAG: hypothetical protein HFF34_07630 [Oscillospiraceae bacterium]|nr:hypothetical protein [Oscillospiraceae bacterium]